MKNEKRKGHRHEESLIQAKLVSWLQDHGIFCHSVPNEASPDKLTTMRLITMGLRPGVADLVVWWPDGIGYVEVKTRTGRQSEAQKRFQKRCLEAGIDYEVIRSETELAVAFSGHCARNWGIPAKKEGDGETYREYLMRTSELEVPSYIETTRQYCSLVRNMICGRVDEDDRYIKCPLMTDKGCANAINLEEVRDEKTKQK